MEVGIVYISRKQFSIEFCLPPPPPPPPLCSVERSVRVNCCDFLADLIICEPLIFYELCWCGRLIITEFCRSTAHLQSTMGIWMVDALRFGRYLSLKWPHRHLYCLLSKNQESFTCAWSVVLDNWVKQSFVCGMNMDSGICFSGKMRVTGKRRRKLV